MYPETFGVSEPKIPEAIVVYLALEEAPSPAAVNYVLELLICILKAADLKEEWYISFLTLICLNTDILLSADEELTNAVVLL